MISKWVVILFLVFTICEYCGNPFESVNKHKWRCKSKLHQSSSSSHIANDRASVDNIVNPELINNRSNVNIEYINCSCGKRCKGFCGLKVHQRLCRVLESMSDNFVDNLENDYNEFNNDENNFDINVDKNLIYDNMKESPSLKKASNFLHQLMIGI